MFVFPIDESVLMDLKALLVEAKQKVPPVLQVLQTGDETMLDIGGKQVMPLGFHALSIKIVLSFKKFLKTFLTYLPHVVSQENGAVRFVVVLAIVSQTVLSWRPCRPSRSPTSGGKITWLIVQWTSKSFFHLRRDPVTLHRTERL